MSAYLERVARRSSAIAVAEAGGLLPAARHPWEQGLGEREPGGGDTHDASAIREAQHTGAAIRSADYERLQRVEANLEPPASSSRARELPDKRPHAQPAMSHGADLDVKPQRRMPAGFNVLEAGNDAAGDPTAYIPAARPADRQPHTVADVTTIGVITESTADFEVEGSTRPKRRASATTASSLEPERAIETASDGGKRTTLPKAETESAASRPAARVDLRKKSEVSLQPQRQLVRSPDPTLGARKQAQRSDSARQRGPRVVIGRLTVEVVNPPAQPSPQPRGVVQATASQAQRPLGVPSKLRFGLGQM